MKKSILTLVALGIAVSVMGQGQLNYSMRVIGVVVGHVYAYNAADGGVRSGNTSSETPAEAQTYAGAVLQGSGFSAQLFAANLAGQAEGTLTSVAGSLTSFRTGSTAGTIPASVISVAQVPIHGTGTFQLRAWDNNNGAFTSYDAAAAAGFASGKSALFTVSNLGDGVLDFPADMANFRSFNLTIVPEPSTFVLAGLGTAALLIFRRRK